MNFNDLSGIDSLNESSNSIDYSNAKETPQTDKMKTQKGNAQK
jgi:hypothetical protein